MLGALLALLVLLPLLLVKLSFQSALRALPTIGVMVPHAQNALLPMFLKEVVPLVTPRTCLTVYVRLDITILLVPSMPITVTLVSRQHPRPLPQLLLLILLPPQMKV